MTEFRISERVNGLVLRITAHDRKVAPVRTEDEMSEYQLAITIEYGAIGRCLGLIKLEKKIWFEHDAEQGVVTAHARRMIRNEVAREIPHGGGATINAALLQKVDNPEDPWRVLKTWSGVSEVA